MEQKSYKIIWERWVLFSFYWCNIYTTWHDRSQREWHPPWKELEMLRCDKSKFHDSKILWRQEKCRLKIGNSKGIDRIKKKVEKWPWNLIAQSLKMSPCGNFRWIIQQKVPGTENHGRKSFFSFPFNHRYDWIARHVFLSLINLKVRKSTFLILWSSNVKTE